MISGVPMVELPHGIIVDERRGSATILNTLVGEMTKLGSDGYIRCERTPSDSMPRVGQVMISKGVVSAAIHESDVILEGLDALIEIEADSMEIDSRLQSVESSDIDRIIELHPQAKLVVESADTVQSSEWWHQISDHNNAWTRASKLPTIDASFDAPEYVKARAASMVHTFISDAKMLTPGSVYSSSSDQFFNLASILKKHGRPLLVMSRKTKEDLVVNYDIPPDSCLWLSQSEGEDVQFVNIEAIKGTIFGFLEGNIRAVLLLDGLEYLSNICGAKDVIDMLRDISDKMRYEDDCLLISFDQNAWTSSQCAQILRAAPPLDTDTVNAWISDPEYLLEHPIMRAPTTEEMEKIAKFIETNTPELTDKEEIIEIENEIMKSSETLEGEEIHIEVQELEHNDKDDDLKEKETGAQKVSEIDKNLVKGPRKAHVVKRRKVKRPKKLTNQDLRLSQLSSLKSDVEIGDLPKAKPIPKIVVGETKNSEFSNSVNLNQTPLGGLSKNLVSRKIPNLPKTPLGPREVEIKPLKDKGSLNTLVNHNLAKKERNNKLSQPAKVQQKIFDVDEKLKSWKKELEEEM